MTALTRSDCRGPALFDDGYVCVLREDHKFAGSPLTKSRHLQSKHILFSPTGSADYGVETYLRPMGIHRHIGLILSHYLAAPLILQNSDMIMTVPSRLAQFYVNRYDVRIVPLPLKVPPISIQVVWNSKFDDRPTYQWFRSLIVDVCSGIGRSARSR